MQGEIVSDDVGLKPLNPRFERVFVCPRCGAALDHWSPQALACGNGHAVPVVRGIPRFVAGDHDVDSVRFGSTPDGRAPRDIHRGESSERLLRDKTGLLPADVEGKLVLDAGMGAGRFTDVLQRWGASVVGVDPSHAVEAANTSFLHQRDVMVAQADLGHLPFRPGSFDLIVSIGALHHTPDTRAYFSRLVPLLKPGGRIAVWLYPREGRFATRAAWIPFTSRIPPRMFYAWCRWFVPFAHRHLQTDWMRGVSGLFPISAQGLGLEHDILDTFDGYSPRFHGVHTPEEVEGWFWESGLIDVERHAVATSVSGIRPPDESETAETPRRNGTGRATRDALAHDHVGKGSTGLLAALRSRPRPSAPTEPRSLTFGQRMAARYWWHHLPNSTFVPPVYAVLSPDEWAVLEAWFQDTDAKKLWGEANISALSVLQGFVMGNIVRNTVQLGIYAGYSTLLVGFMMRRMGLKRSVLSVDIDAPMCAYTERWVREARLRDHVRVECADSSAAHLPGLAREYFGDDIQLAFIDSSHEYAHTLRELDLWSEAIVPGGFVFLHDVSATAEKYDRTQQGGVRRAFTEWTAAHPAFTALSIDPVVAGGDRPLIYKDDCGLGILHRQR